MDETRIPTSAGQETASETVNRIKAAMAAASKERGAPTGAQQGAATVNPIADLLAERLSAQASGISTSASSNLQASINQAIAGTQQAGEFSRQALLSERNREVSFARDRQGAKLTGALEGRTGYATQRIALRELTETTDKEVKDLKQRYDELILQGDAATAQRVADLQMQKLEFLQAQEQNFYSNLIGVANLQQEALSMAQQNEQFMAAQQQQEQQFVRSLEQSEYQFEQNYGLELQRIGLDEQQLELQRQRNQIAMGEYQMKKSQLNQERATSKLEALISQDIRNQVAAGNGEVSVDAFLSPAYMAQVRELTGYEGSADELAEVISRAHGVVTSDQGFMNDASQGTAGPSRVGGVFGEGGVVGPVNLGFGTAAGLAKEALMGVPDGQTPVSEEIDWNKFWSSMGSTLSGSRFSPLY